MTLRYCDMMRTEAAVILTPHSNRSLLSYWIFRASKDSTALLNATSEGLHYKREILFTEAK
jgi:uncharacterized membrane protein YqjE